LENRTLLEVQQNVILPDRHGQYLYDIRYFVIIRSLYIEFPLCIVLNECCELKFQLYSRLIMIHFQAYIESAELASL